MVSLRNVPFYYYMLNFYLKTLIFYGIDFGLISGWVYNECRLVGLGLDQPKFRVSLVCDTTNLNRVHNLIHF